MKRKPWFDGDRINEVVSRLERISAPKLMEANRQAFDLIVQGVEVANLRRCFLIIN